MRNHVPRPRVSMWPKIRYPWSEPKRSGLRQVNHRPGEPDPTTQGQAHIARHTSTRQHMACATTKRTRCIPADSVDSRSSFISCKGNLQIIVMLVFIFVFSRSETHDCHDPISNRLSRHGRSFVVQEHTIKSHSNIISHGVRNAFHTDIPSRPAIVISKQKQPSYPISGVTSGRQRASNTHFLILHWRICIWEEETQASRAGTSAS